MSVLRTDGVNRPNLTANKYVPRAIVALSTQFSAAIVELTLIETVSK